MRWNSTNDNRTLDATAYPTIGIAKQFINNDHSALKNFTDNPGTRVRIGGCTNANSTDELCSLENLSADLDYIAHPIVFYIIGVIMFFVFVLGFTENAVVLYVYIRNRKLRTVSNVFIVGLSLSDIGQAIFNLPLVVIANFSQGWIFGNIGCNYYGFVTTSFGLAQITLLTVIALERYCIIVHHSRVFSQSMTVAVVAICCCFIYGSSWALGPLLGWSEYKIETYGTRCAVSWDIKNMTYLSYTLCLFTFVWFIPLFLITFGYTSIACMIYREKSTKLTIRSSLETKSTKEQKVAITVLIMIGAFVVSWMPYSAVALYTAINGTSDLPFATTLIPALIAKSSIIWNPIIYVVRHRDFRRACVKTLKTCKICKDKQSGDSSLKAESSSKNQYQENLDTNQKLLKQSSMSYSECTSSRDSCAGTKISGLMFETFDSSFKERIPKLTSKEGWRHSPHPIVRRSFEQKKNQTPSIDQEIAEVNRNADSITKSCLRKNFLKNVGTSKTLSTVIDIECETGQSTRSSVESLTRTENSTNTEAKTVAIHSAVTATTHAQSKTVKPRRHLSYAGSTQKAYNMSYKDSSRRDALRFTPKPDMSSTMFDTRCDEVYVPYRRKSSTKANVGGRRHLSDSSTTVNKSKYYKCDAKHKRYMLRRQKNCQQKIEMSVFESCEPAESMVFNFEEIKDELEGMCLQAGEDEDQPTFEEHIGACSVIRQSTV